VESRSRMQPEVVAAAVAGGYTMVFKDLLRNEMEVTVVSGDEDFEIIDGAGNVISSFGPGSLEIEVVIRFKCKGYQVRRDVI
jgi:hypothetical protein